MNKIVILTGPTASGKTKLAIEIANKYNGEIISADSMQIYKNLNIGTAKPTKDELLQAKHHMIDIAEANQDYSVQEYVKQADKIIAEICSNNKLPIIVGGTGLYIKALIHPYSFANTPKDEKVRDYYKSLLEEYGQDYIYNLLQTLDQDSAKTIHPNDTKRVIRALEICSISKEKKSLLNNETNNNKYDYLMFVLNPKREELYQKINARVDDMFSCGLESEIKNLLEKGLASQQSQSMQAIGYKEFFDYFHGELDLNTTKELIKQHSRNYAKRQITFFKSFKDAVWIENPQENKQTIITALNNFLNQ